MGTPARIYAPLAEAFAAQGLNVAVIELRGIASSSLRAGKRVDYGYRTMQSLDWDVACRAVRARFSGAPLFLLGHSLGGQLSVLHAAAQPQGLAGVVLVAAGSVYYRGWSGFKRVGILAFTQFAGAIAGALGYFPGKRLRFGGTEARTLMQDWARLARTGRFDFAGGGTDYETAMAQLRLPVLGLSFEHDGLAPHRSQKNLLNKLVHADVTHLPLSAQDTGQRLDHYNWIRKADAVVPRVRDWIGTVTSC